jgi:hypothetical protein
MQKRKHSDDFDVFIWNMFEEHLPFHLLNYFMLTLTDIKGYMSWVESIAILAAVRCRYLGYHTKWHLVSP